MPPNVPNGYTLERSRSVVRFSIGVFGALAIIGVMAKIFSFSTEVFGYLITWKPVVLIGFLGEACVFIMMGTMSEMQYVPVDEAKEPTDKSSSGSPSAVEEKLTEETQDLAEQIRSVRQDLNGQTEVLEEFNELHDNLQKVNSSFSKESKELGEEIVETRKVLQVLREQFAEATRRFEQFNAPPPKQKQEHSAGDRTNNVSSSAK